MGLHGSLLRPNTLAGILRHLRAGEGYPAIGRRFGVSYSTVYHVARENGLRKKDRRAAESRRIVETPPIRNGRCTGCGGKLADPNGPCVLCRLRVPQ